jgi:hypothetical protein
MALATADLAAAPSLANQGETLPQLFRRAVSVRGDKTAFREKVKGIWRAVSSPVTAPPSSATTASTG